MNVEFVFPADSAEVIDSANIPSAPSVSDKVNIKGVHYRVYNTEWYVFDKAYNTGEDKVGIIVHLIKDEIEEHAKKKSKGKKNG